MLPSIMKTSFTTWISPLCISTSACTCEKKLHICEAFQFLLCSEGTIESIIWTRAYFTRYMKVINPSCTKSLQSFRFHCNTLGDPPPSPAAFWNDGERQNIFHYQFHWRICFFPCHFLLVVGFLIDYVATTIGKEPPEKGNTVNFAML